MINLVEGSIPLIKRPRSRKLKFVKEDRDDPFPDRRGLTEFSYNPKVIDSQRFWVGDLIGAGTTGEVYRVIDKANNNAVGTVKILKPTDEAKAEMKRCGITEDGQRMAESSFYQGAAHVMPRTLQFDDKGNAFILMPEAKFNLESVIGHDKNSSDDPTKRRKSVKPSPDNLYLDEQTALNIGAQLAYGLCELHDDNLIHADIKPANVLVTKNGTLRYTDFADSRKRDFLTTTTVNDNRGCRHTKAPECKNKEGQPGRRPTAASDVFGWGSMMLRLYDGRYADEITQGIESEKGQEKALKKSCKAIPRQLRNVVIESLKYNPYKRICTGTELVEKLDEAIDSLNGSKLVKRSFRKWGYATLAAGLVGVGIAYLAAYSPDSSSDLTMPQLSGHGPLNAELNINEGTNAIRYAKESLTDLPRVHNLGMALDFKGVANGAARDNKNTAFLLKAYLDASFDIDNTMPHMVEYSREQFKTFNANTSSTERLASSYLQNLKIIKNCIVYGLSSSVNKDGFVDLEDALVKARCGQQVWENAVRQANNANYVNYRNYLPEKDKRFVQQWLGRINGPN